MPSDDLRENDPGEPDAQVAFVAEHGELDVVELDGHRYLFRPPIPLTVGELYCVQVWDKQVRLWLCVVDHEVTESGMQH